MSEENKINKTIQKENSSEMNIDENNEILNSEFLKSLETPQKLPEKKSKITKLINFFQENQTYLLSLKETKNLEHLYDIILTNLNENNNNFVICQINLIKIISEQISSNENVEIKSSFIKFFKNALPKLFDKFYLQNEKINKNLIDIFIFVIQKNILKYDDYFPLVENICIEEDEEYKINILNFMLKLINNEENIYKENIPTNILDIIEKLSKNEENENLKEISGNIIKILNERKKQVNINIEGNKNDQLDILNTPLNQKDSKLAFSSFIKKISKAVREENLNKHLINNNSKIENNENFKKDINNDKKINEFDNNIIQDVDIEKKSEEKNIVPQNGQTGKELDENEMKNKKDENDQESQQKIDKINEISSEQKENDENITPNKTEDYIEQNVKNNNVLNEDNKILEENKIDNETIDNIENSQRIKTEISQCQINEENKKIIKNNIEKQEIAINDENNNEPLKEEQEEKQKETKNEKKENKNKKLIKNRISRSRKLGVMVKNKNNKTEGKIKEDNNKKDLQENNIQISVNKINSKQKEIINEKKEEKNEEQLNIEIEQNYIDNNILNEEALIKENKENLNENSEKEVQIKEHEEQNKIQEEDNDNDDNRNNNLKEVKDLFDEIPIIKSKEQLLEDSYHEEENGIKISKNFSIDEFNKKIDSALEQEHMDQLDKENSESNTNEKTEKEKDIDDPKYNEIKSKLGSELCDLFSSNKWENKKHALEQINIFLNEKDIEFNPNDLFNYIKSKMKNFKETNFNIIRESFNVFISLLRKKNLSKDNLLLLINIYYEKLADIKLKDNLIELINVAIEESIIDLNSIIFNLISKISKKKNPKILNEYSNLFIKLIEENNTKDLPINEIVNYCKLMAGNTNPQVRNSATNLICTLYKYLGEDLKPLLKDIKESTLKIIEAELEKIVIEKKEMDKNKNAKKIIKKNSKNEKNPKSIKGELNPEEEGDSNININGPVDISKKINAHLKDLSDGKWSEKKEAYENIKNILLEANHRILPTGLNDFFILIKNKLSDSNKNYIKMLISLLSEFISALKKDFKPWSKMIAQSLIPNLSDKNQSIRNECQKCFEIWIDNIGFDSLVIYFPQFLKNDSVESRIEIMNFIKKYNEHFPKNLAENIYKELTDGLLLCLQDKANNVRNEAEDIILLSLDYIDIEIYYKKIKDFKPVIEKDLKLILDNISQQKYNNDIEKEKENEDNEELDINSDDNYNSQNINSYNNDINIQKESNKSNNKK